MVIFLLFLLFLLLIGLSVLTVFFYLRKRPTGSHQSTSKVLSTFTSSEEEVEDEHDLREIEIHRHWLYRISGVKWILSFVFALLLTFVATYENWFRYYPDPVVGKPYPVSISVAYDYVDPDGNHIHPGRDSQGKRVSVMQRGEIADAADLERVRAYNEQRHAPPVQSILGYMILFLLFVLSMVYWLSQWSLELHQDENRNFVFLFLAILLVVAFAKAVYMTKFISVYYIPVSMLGILVAILISSRIVPSVVIFTDFFIGMMTGFDFKLLMILFAGSLVTVFLSQRIKKRSQILAVGLLAGFIKFLLFDSMLLINDEVALNSVDDIRQFFDVDAVACLLGGLISGFLAIFLITGFEKLFGFASPFRLQELADMDSPVLHALYLHAPGTYHHSMAAANLGEIAANEIGADALLVRVAGYYHDIGKLANPSYFVENLPPGAVNPHDNIQPFMSAKIVRGHIHKGLKYGREHHLPRKILDFIPQHHGTTLLDFFYEKARKNIDPEGMKPGALDPRYFMYAGPKPKTRETAILMIVDSVEAASRVLADHSEETVRKMIEKIIARKLEQGQLDESPITAAELRKITYVLAKALSTASHKRVDYPKESGIYAQFHADVRQESQLGMVPNPQIEPAARPAEKVPEKTAPPAPAANPEDTGKLRNGAPPPARPAEVRLDDSGKFKNLVLPPYQSVAGRPAEDTGKFKRLDKKGDK